MPRFKKGVVQNPNGCTRGKGKLQVERARILRAEIVDQRFKLALKALDDWNEARINLILDYSTLKADYFVQLDQDHEIHRRVRDRGKRKNITVTPPAR